MQPFANVWEREFQTQWAALEQAREVVLYGRSVLQPVVETALRELGVSAPLRVFDRGRFIDGGPCLPRERRVVVLCGMRAATRESMDAGAREHFPDAAVYDGFAVYYKWLTELVKRPCDREALAETLLAVREEQAIPNIDSINTTCCNLACRACSNAIPYRSDRHHVPVDEHIRALTALTRVRPVAYCNLQGGEPLLDRALPERLLRHAKDPGIGFLSLATNGTILPDEAVMQAMRDSGTMLRISDYGALSTQKQALMEMARAYAVPCDVYHRAETWVDYGPLTPHGRTEEENRRAAAACHFGTKDLMLYDGRLYCCCRTLFADAVGLDSEAVRANVLDLRKPFDRDALDRIVDGAELHRMCDYCASPMAVIPVAEQLPRGK